MSGSNLYDPYSGYGPCGRHNREYTRHELALLLSHCGFEPEVMFSADVGPNRADAFCDPRSLVPGLTELAARPNDLGQYLFVRWRKARERDPRLPHWLYRSYPAEQLEPTPL